MCASHKIQERINEKMEIRIGNEMAPRGLPEETLPNETYFGFLTFLTLR